MQCKAHCRTPTCPKKNLSKIKWVVVTLGLACDQNGQLKASIPKTNYTFSQGHGGHDTFFFLYHLSPPNNFTKGQVILGL